LISCDNAGDYFSQDELLIGRSQVLSPLHSPSSLSELAIDLPKLRLEIANQSPAPFFLSDLPGMVIVKKIEKMGVAMIESPSSYQDFFP
jgi:hypothetical protein